jgi:hypothetical protein
MINFCPKVPQSYDELLGKAEEEKVQSDDDSFELEPQEFTFLIDLSGSMYMDNAKPVKMARDALNIFLHSLPEGSFFNICAFGSTHQFLFPAPVQYS